MRAEVYSIKGPWSGQLAILARPRGNDWLVDEVKSDAFEEVSAGRRAAVPDTVAQREWVYKFAKNLRSGSSLSFAK
jgi:hypothetical protein